MATQLWSTGPALFYVAPMRISSGQSTLAQAVAPRFLGTCDEKPQIEVEREYSPVYNDEAGGRPADRMYEGQSAMTVADFDKFDYTVMNYLEAASAPGGALSLGVAPLAGVDYPGDVGTLMATEQTGFALYVYFPYAAKSSYGPNGMVPGYYFPFTVVSRDSIASGTVAHKRRLVLEHERVRDGNYSNPYGFGRWILYLHDAALFTGLPNPV